MNFKKIIHITQQSFRVNAINPTRYNILRWVVFIFLKFKNKESSSYCIHPNFQYRFNLILINTF